MLYDDLSVQEHLEYTVRMHGGDGDEDVIDQLIDDLGLRGREDDLPSQFSRGLRQKTAAAVALCRPFSLLLVDEPFVGLDASGREAFLELLDDAHDAGADPDGRHARSGGARPLRTRPGARRRADHPRRTGRGSGSFLSADTAHRER